MSKSAGRHTITSPKPSLRDKQKQARREQILGAAQTAFRDRGFENTTVAHIAAEAMLSPATVFNYFGTKEALLLELLAEEHDAWLAAVASLDERSAPADAVEQLASFFITATELSLATLGRSDWRHVEAACIRQPDTPFVKRYQEMVAAMVKQLQQTVERLVRCALAPPSLSEPAIVDMVFNQWGARFTALITADEMTLDEHKRCINTDIQALMRALSGKQ